MSHRGGQWLSGGLKIAAMFVNSPESWPLSLAHYVKQQSNSVCIHYVCFVLMLFQECSSGLLDVILHVLFGPISAFRKLTEMRISIAQPRLNFTLESGKNAASFFRTMRPVITRCLCVWGGGRDVVLQIADLLTVGGMGLRWPGGPDAPPPRRS